jgi:two-component system, cell cycle sensor histidine kinase and response regulator CckA
MNQPPAEPSDRSVDSRDVQSERQAELLETVGRLAGGIAHDFNNVLAAILGYSELLDNQLRVRGDCDAERQDLKEIQRAAERAKEQMQRLLAFAQRLPSRSALVEPQLIVRGIERLLKRLAPLQVEFVVLLTSVPGYIDVDRTQIERALTLLTVNGFDAMPEGGTLTISAEWREVATEGLPTGVVIGRRDNVAGTCMHYRVSDTGRGMSADELEQAFHPYVTSKNTNDIGSGLGLSAVYGLVAKAGGVIVVESTLSGGTALPGTNVHILIPRAFSETEASVATPQA